MRQSYFFGTNNRIMSVLPQHKTDAIFRVFNVDRYDVLHIWGVSFFYSKRSRIGISDLIIGPLFSPYGLLMIGTTVIAFVELINYKIKSV